VLGDGLADVLCFVDGVADVVLVLVDLGDVDEVRILDVELFYQ
jgi:hypothetical protein